jgi:dipeptidyl aminopeptidase/acylaminoacyl peptidase
LPAVIYLHGTLEKWPAHRLERALRGQTLSRFLAAGYVTVAATYRSREQDPQSPGALWDCLAAVEYVKTMPEVDPESVVLWGVSGGGSLALEAAGETRLAAAAVEEPASILFTGMLTNAADRKVQMRFPHHFYTPALRRLTREKIARITAPILIAAGDVHPINRINNEILVPELRRAGKRLELITYPGAPHGFSQGSGSPEAVRKFFEDVSGFFGRHVNAKPVPLRGDLLMKAPAERETR